MGRMKENPRYHVLSIRVTDEELERIDAVKAGTRQAFLLEAVMRHVFANEFNTAVKEAEGYLERECPEKLRELRGR